MTKVVFISNTHGIQSERIEKISKGLKERRPDIKVEMLDVQKHTDLLEKFNLHHGPFILIDDKLLFVGIPRLKMLLDKIDAQTKKKLDEQQKPAENEGKKGVAGDSKK